MPSRPCPPASRRPEWRASPRSPAMRRPHPNRARRRRRRSAAARARRMRSAARSNSSASAPGRRTTCTRWREKLRRVLERLGLHVLAQAQRDRAALGRIGQGQQGARERREELLRAGDAIPIARDRLEAVVHACRRIVPGARSAGAPGRGGGWRTRRRAATAPAADWRARRRRRSACSSPRDRSRSCRPSSAADCSPWRTPRRRAPCPARYGRGRSAGRRALDTAPRRCRRRCRGRRWPSIRRTGEPCARPRSVRWAPR